MTKKGITGTHYKTAANRKTGVISLRLYPDELAKIRTRAKKKGVSVSQYAHDAVMKSITPNKRAVSDSERAKKQAQRSAK